MFPLNSHPSGRHFLQIPGPTNVPDRILRAIDNATIDHRGPEFGVLGKAVLAGMKKVFKTQADVVIYPSSGTGAWEAALVNTLSSGDLVLMAETGHFAVLWKKMALRLGLQVEFLPGDWRHGADAAQIQTRLADDNEHKIKAVCVVHNETATGAVTDVHAVRQAINRCAHPALLLVDAISSLGAIDYRHDEWGVDVCVAGSQKGLMLTSGLSFNAISAKALAAAQNANLPRSYWDWGEMLAINPTGYFPYTPATNLLYGLHESLEMLFGEGLENVFARHKRHGEATRRAVWGWGLEIVCSNPQEYSPALTAVLMPQGFNADLFRKTVLENFNMSLGQGLSKLSGKVFRIGHLGDLNDLSLCAALAGIEMGLAVAGVPHKKGGVQVAMDYLTEVACTGSVKAAAN